MCQVPDVASRLAAEQAYSVVWFLSNVLRARASPLPFIYMLRQLARAQFGSIYMISIFMLGVKVVKKIPLEINYAQTEAA